MTRWEFFWNFEYILISYCSLEVLNGDLDEAFGVSQSLAKEWFELKTSSLLGTSTANLPKRGLIGKI